MLSPGEISMLTATVGSGLTAGLCFAFSAFVMKAFDRLGAPQAIRAMQSINTTILRSSRYDRCSPTPTVWPPRPPSRSTRSRWC